MLPAGHRGRLGVFAVPLTAEQRVARAKLAAARRHYGDDAVLPPDAAELERTALDRHIAAVTARAGQMTPEQVATIRRVFTYGPADEST
jgi:hypothetical protein